MIAPTKRIEAIGSGIPFDEIYSAVFEKPIPSLDDVIVEFLKKYEVFVKLLFGVLLHNH